MPALRTATVSTTGIPRRSDNFCVLICIPRRRASSIMFNTSNIGRPKLIISRTRPRCSFKLVASTTHMNASCCPSSAILPCTTSRVISSSGLVASKLYVPGKSNTRTALPEGKVKCPTLRSTVTPA